MKVRLLSFLTVVLLVALTAGSSWAAVTITAGEYRFVIGTAYTQLVDPYDGRVYDESCQGQQWAIGEINEIDKKIGDFWEVIWQKGNDVPGPHTNNATHKYINAILGNLTFQPDPQPGFLGLAPANNTGLTYNVRVHDTAPGLPQGTGLAHPDDYVDSTPGVEPLPQNVFFIAPDATTAEQEGSAYVKIYSTASNVFNTDVAVGIGAGCGDTGSFASNTTAGTLLLDLYFDHTALAIQEASGDSLDSTGLYAHLRAQGTSDTEAGINAFLQVQGAGLWDTLFDSNSPDLYGSDVNLQFTTRAMIGSPYLPPQGGQSTDGATQFGWDFRDVGDAQAKVLGEELSSCRVTAGGVEDIKTTDGIVTATSDCELKNNGQPNLKTCVTSEAPDGGKDTWGGQAGASGIDGNWTHHHAVSPRESFVFHSNDLFEIVCSDPGDFCEPARPSDTRQIDFKGIGRFTNSKGYPSLPTGDTCFAVHLEDLGEPGPGGKWPSSAIECPHIPGTVINNATDCVNCTDYYEIRIYDNLDCSGTPIYVNGDSSLPTPLGGYFIRSGNVQMHPGKYK